MKKIVLVLFALCIVLIATIYLSTEAYIPFAPYIDTTFSKDFSWEKWQNVEAGMTKSQVHTLMGAPLSSFSGMEGYYGLKSGKDYNNHDCEVYSNDGGAPGWDFAWISINVCYDSTGHVLGKNELIMYN